MVATMGHADREQPGRWYLKGLVLPGGRKSVEPMAARVQPERVRSAHRSMHRLVAEAQWSDEAMLLAVARQVLPELVRADEPVFWILDDTGLPKKGKHSVGVAHRYCGQTGKQDNCRVAVTLSIATHAGSLPVGFRLYLPREWTGDEARCRKAGVPSEVGFATKPHLAWEQIEAALQAGYPRGAVRADAAYGDETAWREKLAGRGLTYAVGVRPATTVWWGRRQPAPAPARASGAEEPAHYWFRPARGCALAAHGRHRDGPLAHRARLSGTQAGTRPGSLRGAKLERLSPPCQSVRGGLRISDAGATVQRQKNSARFKTPDLPAALRPRGAGADAAPHTLVDRNVSLPVGTHYRQNLATVPLLRSRPRADAPASRSDINNTVILGVCRIFASA